MGKEKNKMIDKALLKRRYSQLPYSAMHPTLSLPIHEAGFDKIAHCCFSLGIYGCVRQINFFAGRGTCLVSAFDNHRYAIFFDAEKKSIASSIA